MSADYNEGFVDRFIETDDGLSLHARLYGEHLPGEPIICLPGLTRNARDFHQLALNLSRSAQPSKVVAIDSRGRGLSDWDSDESRYTLAVEALDVIHVLDSLGIDRAAFIGTSRGGLILHLLAVSHPGRLSAIILNDIGPVIEVEGLRQIQAYLRGERQPRDFDEATAILREVHGSGFPVLSDRDWHDMAHAIYRQRGGSIRPDYDPAIAAQFCAADLSQPLPDLWQNFAGFANLPLMAIRGATSRLLSPDTIAEMERRHPGMASLTAAGQGHAPILHLDGIPQHIQAFLAARFT